jgi:hypothetical protein
MKRLTPWHPHLKKGKAHLPLRQPQFVGNPGWMLLSHSPQGRAEALFVDTHDAVTPVPIVLDERLFSDTVLRVIRVSPSLFVACDIRYLNGVNLFERLSFADRKARLAQLLVEFHAPDLTALVLPEDVPHGTLLRGYESYDDQPGTLGVFLPATE